MFKRTDSENQHDGARRENLQPYKHRNNGFESRSEAGLSLVFSVVLMLGLLLFTQVQSSDLRAGWGGGYLQAQLAVQKY
jgi:hypothetical protein